MKTEEQMEYLGRTIYYGHVNMAYYAEQRGVVPIREYGYSTQAKAINAVKRRIKKSTEAKREAFIGVHMRDNKSELL